MNFKVFATFLVTLVAVQARSTKSPLEASSAKDVAALVLEDVLRVTGALLEKSHQVVNDLRANEESIRAKIVSRVVQVADRVNHEVLSLVDHLKDGASEEGKAVLSCIEAEEPKVDAAIEQFANDAGDCVGDRVDIVLYEADVLLNQLDDLQDDVQGQVDRLRDCDSSDVSCFLQLAQSAIATVQRLRPIVARDIDAIQQLAKTIREQIASCHLREEFRSYAQEIFNDAVVCVKS